MTLSSRIPKPMMDYSGPCNYVWYGCLDYEEVMDGQKTSMAVALTATRPRQLTARDAGRNWKFW